MFCCSAYMLLVAHVLHVLVLRVGLLRWLFRGFGGTRWVGFDDLG